MKALIRKSLRMKAHLVVKGEEARATGALIVHLDRVGHDRSGAVGRVVWRRR
jgi:hypothetical protein